MKLGLANKYGGSALVTGAARGIGRAFAMLLAEDGFDLVLVDRDEEETTVLAELLTSDFGVRAIPSIRDVGEPGLADDARRWAEDHEVGLLVNNAGLSPLDPFLDIALDDHLRTLDVNCRATLVLTHVFGSEMAARGRGGIVIVSSASALSGSPYACHYAATKGYGLNLAAGLWSELEGSGVDVLAVCPGVTDTPAVQDHNLDENRPFYVPLSDPERVALGALRSLGKGPMVVPTWADRMSSVLMSRLVPRRWTLSMIKRSIDRMRG